MINAGKSILTVGSAKLRAINPGSFYKFKFGWKRFPQPTEKPSRRLSTRWVVRVRKNYQKEKQTNYILRS